MIKLQIKEIYKLSSPQTTWVFFTRKFDQNSFHIKHKLLNFTKEKKDRKKHRIFHSSYIHIFQNYILHTSCYIPAYINKKIVVNIIFHKNNRLTLSFHLHNSRRLRTFQSSKRDNHHMKTMCVTRIVRKIKKFSRYTKKENNSILFYFSYISCFQQIGGLTSRRETISKEQLIIKAIISIILLIELTYLYYSY